MEQFNINVKNYAAGIGRDTAGFLLKTAAVILAEYHILWCLLHSFVWKFPYQKYEKRFTLCLIGASFVFLIIKTLRQTDPPGYLRRHAKSFFNREQCILLAVFIWFVIDCAIHQILFGGTYFKDNDWRMFQFGLAITLFFGFVRITGPKYARRAIEGMINFTVVIYGSFCAYVLWRYLHADYFTFPSGRSLELLVNKNMSMKMGVNQNITAAQLTVMLGLCLYMIFTQKKIIKAVYLIPSAIFFMLLVLSNSRASYFACMCMVVMGIGVYAFRKLRLEDSGKNSKKDLIGQKGESGAGLQYIIMNNRVIRAAVVVIVIVICALLIRWLRRSVFLTVQNSTDGSVDAGNALRSIERGLSGRDLIWRAAITMLLSSPRYFFLGVMPSQVGQTLVDLQLDSMVQRHCHNLLLQIAASLGVPAMIVFCVFLVSLMIRAVRIILIRDPRYEHAWAVTIPLAGILVIDLVETFLFGPSFVNLPVFYLFAGWLTALDQSYMNSKKHRKKTDDIEKIHYVRSR